MRLAFSKYQGAGNDFVLIDNRDHKLDRPSQALVARLCHRRFGIGADGLMLLQPHPSSDFEMIYYNSDGNLSTMCGNGGRCIAGFAHRLGIVGAEARFMAVDGLHRAKILAPNRVALEMLDVDGIRAHEDASVLDTGSPHFVRFVPDAQAVDVFAQGRAVRYSPAFAEKGINVNFVQILDDQTLHVATYERGVEDETYSCGTGVVASVLAYAHRYGHRPSAGRVSVQTKGGELAVEYTAGAEKATFSDIWLHGGAEWVFDGEWALR